MRTSPITDTTATLITALKIIKMVRRYGTRRKTPQISIVFINKFSQKQLNKPTK
jgi:hypothetical protein